MIQNLSEKEFYELVKTSTIPELESLVHEFGAWNLNKSERWRVKRCLMQRATLLHQQFECTPENLERLQNVANMIKERRTMLHKKGNQLYKEILHKQLSGENEPFSDFYIEVSLRIHYNSEESILHLPDDNSGSDYFKMAEFLDCFSNDFTSNLIWAGNSIHYNPEDLKQIFKYDSEFENSELLWEQYIHTFPELKKVLICDGMHHLIDHTEYALQDIIRVNDVWGEVKAVWQHIAGIK